MKKGMSDLMQLELQKSGVNQKRFRCKKFEDEKEKAPISFKENTPKEELVIEHVTAWKTQFEITYNPNRPLLLLPCNECGKVKFICTTIRPTKLPFKELYDWENCCHFLANHLEYEELEPPDRLPPIVPAPANVLTWQAGDCFDFSILLASLLIGNGYDAFVVYGRAPKEITTRDESMLPCPITSLPTLPSDEAEVIQPPSKEKKYDIEESEWKQEVIEPATSKYDAYIKQKEEEDMKSKARAEVEITDDEPEYEKADPYKDRRLHCWILVKRGKRDIKENFFIEPTTGRHYNVSDNPYLSIECIFNHRNFWVNMKPELPVEQVGIHDFDLKEGCEKEWEYVMLPTVHKYLREMEEGGGVEIIEEEETRDDILDLPTPWSPKLFVKKETGEESSFATQKTIFFLKSKVDIYAPYSQPDLMVNRITLYKDYKRQIIQEVRCVYANRSDKLLYIVVSSFPQKEQC